MATDTQEIMLVRADVLHKHPKAFQEFVEKFFEKKVIFGFECYFAFTFLHVAYENNNKKGVAPRHNSDVDYFGKKASVPCESLSDLIRELEKDKDSGVCEISQWFDDGRGWAHVD